MVRIVGLGRDVDIQSFDVSRFRKFRPDTNQYDRQLARLRALGKDVTSIEAAVGSALDNLSGRGAARLCNLRRTAKRGNRDDDLFDRAVVGRPAVILFCIF